MQALLLNGSPRGAASNTLRLSRAFLQGTGWPFETFSLTENRIEPCRGCMACWRSGAPCTIADDFSAFVGQFRRADVLIASFPLYYFGLPAQSPAGSDDQPDGAIPRPDAGGRALLVPDAAGPGAAAQEARRHLLMRLYGGRAHV